MRVEVAEVGEAGVVELAGALGDVFGAAALGATRQEVHLRLRRRDRRVALAQDADELGLILQRNHVRLAGLEPRPVDPGRSRPWLAPSRGGESPQRLGRARPGEDPEVERAAVDVGAPDVVAVARERKPARLVAVDKDAVAAAREQPRDREIGRVVAVAQPPGRRRREDELAVFGRSGAVGDVVLDLAAALVDRVRALAEAEEALAGRRSNPIDVRTALAPRPAR